MIQAPSIKEALEHARSRFACLAEDFAANGSNVDRAMCEVDAERMERALATLPPSDRPADVTVDDLAVVLANARRAAHGSAPMTKEEAGYVHLWPDGSELKTQARALLDAFTVGRR